MKELKAITATENRIEEILSGRAAELEALAKQIEQESADIETVNQEMETATAAGDVEGYRKAKAKRAAVMDGKEMHESRLNALRNKPLITKEEYDKTVSDVFAEYATLDDLTREKLYKLSNEMNAAAEELRKAQIRANEALRRLQDDIYRGADRSINEKTGELLRLPTEDKRIDKWNTINWGQSGVSHYQYKIYADRVKSEESKG